MSHQRFHPELPSQNEWGISILAGGKIYAAKNHTSNEVSVSRPMPFTEFSQTGGRAGAFSVSETAILGTSNLKDGGDWRRRDSSSPFSSEKGNGRGGGGGGYLVEKKSCCFYSIFLILYQNTHNVQREYS